MTPHHHVPKNRITLLGVGGDYANELPGNEGVGVNDLIKAII